MDGAGGPGLAMTTNTPYTPPMKNYSNLVIMGGTPPIRVPFGKKPPQTVIASNTQPVMDGAGGPGYTPQTPTQDIGSAARGIGDLLSRGLSAIGDFMTTPRTSLGGLGTPPALRYQQASQQPYQPSTPGSGGALAPQDAFRFAQQPLPGAQQAAPQIGNFTPSPAPAPRMPWDKLSITNNVPGQQAFRPGQAGQAPQQPAQQQSTQRQGGRQGGQGQQPMRGGGAPGGMQQQRQQSSQFYPGIQQAVDKGVGPTMFAYGAMGQGADYLKTLPGFENLSESMLEGAPTLSGRVEQLKNTLRHSYHLDELLNQYTGLIQQGVGLEGRLTDYIRGRDEFLNQTNDMLESFKDQMLSMDLSDPETRRSAQQYSNYLYELRGRQNKRYIEFLKTSIDEYNGRLQAVGTMYQTALDGYQRELQRETDITREEYQMMFGGLMEMYNNVADAPRKALELQKLQGEVYSTWMTGARDAAGMYGAENSDYFSDTLKQLKQANIIDTHGRWNPLTSIDDIETYASLGIDPTNFLQAMRLVGRNSLTQPDKDGLRLDTTGIMEMSGSLLNNIGRYAQYGANTGDYTTVQQASGIADELKDATAQAFFVNGVLSDAQGPVIRDAVNYLAGGSRGWSVFGGGGAPSRDKLLDRFQNSGLDTQFLNALYSDFEGYLESNDKNQYATYTLNEVQNGNPVRPYSDNELAMNLARSVAHKLGWGAGI